jgi:hypothetical protein
VSQVYLRDAHFGIINDCDAGSAGNLIPVGGDMDRVFRWIRRINSILFLLVLIGGSFGAFQLYVSYLNMMESYTAPNQAAEIAAPERDADAVALSLGDAELVRGTDITAIALYSTEGAGSRRSRRHEQMRNVLFLSENGARWLFETHTNILLEFDELRRGEQPTRAFYYEIQATNDDSLTIALSKADGTNLTEILTGIARVLSHEQTDDQAVSIIYQIDDKLWHARFDLETFSKLSEQSLVDVPQQM